MATKSTKLLNPTSLGMHLSAGAGDGMLTSAEYVFDETREQSVQDTLDELVNNNGSVKTVNGEGPDEEGNISIEIPSIDGLLTKDQADEIYQPVGDYLTEHQSLEGLVKTVNGNSPDENGAVTIDIPSLDGYATEEWVGEQGFLTEHQSLAGYVKTVNGEVPDESGNVTITFDDPDLTGFLTKTAADELYQPIGDYLTEHQSLEDYYTKDEVNSLVAPKLSFEVITDFPTGDDIKDNVIYLKAKDGAEEGDGYNEYVYSNGSWELIGSASADMTGYATEEWVNEQGFLTEHQSLEDYQKKLTFTSSDDSITIDTESTEDTVDLIVKNPLTDEMAEFLEEAMAITYSYSVAITADKESASVGDEVTFTATFSATKGNAISSEPVAVTSVTGLTLGWTRVSDSIYTKKVTVVSSMSTVSSGEISGSVVNSDNKSGAASAEAVELNVVKSWFIFESAKDSFTSTEGASLVNSFISGSATPLKSGVAPVSNETNTVFRVATDKDYVWFAIPNTSELISVEQLSTNVLLVNDSYEYITTIINTSAGEYKLYRWAVSLSDGTIAAKVNIK